MKTQPKESRIENSWVSRNLIALIITALVVGVTVYIAIYLLYTPDKSGKIDTAFIGQTLLPLWGTWIGTVLAYYFGKANFEAATKSYHDALKKMTPEEKIAQLKVKEVMLPIKDIVYLDMETSSPKTINELLKLPEFEPYNRYAVFDKNKMVKYMIHRSTFFQFIYLKYAEQKAQGLTPDVDQLTLNDLLNCADEKIKNTLTRGIGFIALDANLLDAKRVMDATDECQDVFVTQSGKASEPVLGLITNTRIFQYAKV